MCLFCNQIINFEESKYGIEKDTSIVTHAFTQSIIDCCKDRCDEWAYKGKSSFTQMIYWQQIMFITGLVA